MSTPEEENIKSEEDLIQERIDQVKDAHVAPERLLRDAQHALGSERALDDPAMDEFIARSAAVKQLELETGKREREDRAAPQVSKKLRTQIEKELSEQGFVSSETKGKLREEVSRTGRLADFPEAYSRSGREAPERFASIMRPISGKINANPSSHRRDVGQARRTLENSRRSVIQAFTVRDPLTNEPAEKLTQSQVEELAGHIQQSFHGTTADEREFAANQARKITAKHANRVQEESDSRWRAIQAATLERQARVAAGQTELPPGTMPGGSHYGGPYQALGDEVHPSPRFMLKDYYNVRTFEKVSEKTGNPTGRLVDSPFGERHIGIIKLEDAKSKVQGQIKLLERKGQEVPKHLKAQHEMLKVEIDLRKGQLNKLETAHLKSLQEGRDAATSRLRGVPKEQRLNGLLNPLTLEETYAASGHEKAKGLAGLKGQAKFTGRNIKNFYSNAAKGTLVSHWSSEGKRVPDKKDAAISIGPNKNWRYTLNRNPEQMKRNENLSDRHWKNLDYGDTETRFHRAKRDRWGNILPGDWEEMQSEHLIAKFHKTANTDLGKRGIKVGKSDDVSKDIFIPVSGIKKTSTRTVPGEGVSTKRLVQLNGRWVPATQADWELRQGIEKTGLRRPSGAARYGTEQYDKVARVHYVPTDQMHLLDKEKDRLHVVLPGDRVVSFGLDESTDRQRRLNNAVFGYSRAKEQYNRVAESEAAARAEDIRRGNAAQHVLNHPELMDESNKDYERVRQPGDPDFESKLHSLVAAGGAASLYGIRRNIKKGYAPQWANQVVESYRGSHPRADKWLTEHNAATFAVNDAYVRPVGEKVANEVFKVRHPLSDPDGETMGIQWGKLYNRQHWISNDKKMSRLLKRRSNEIERVQRTREWYERNAYSSNPVKKVLLKRRDHNLRHKDYLNFTQPGGLLDKAIVDTREIRARSSGGSSLEREANVLAARIGQLRQLGGNTPEALARERNWTGTRLPGAPLGKHIEGGHMVSDSAMSNLARVAGNHRNLLIGAGVVGTAVGAHYAYHRYQEHKKPPEERTAYYNKVLPKPFTVSTPHVRATGFLRLPDNIATREFGMDNKRVKARLGFSLEPHTFNFRPKDRGYEPGLPLTGDLKLRGHTQGSWIESLIHNPDAVYNRKARYRDRTSVVVKGKELPIYAEFGDRKRMKLSSTNPNRVTQHDRENLVWAYKDTPEEGEVKNFYGHDRRLQEMFSDEKEVSRIRRRKGTEEAKRYEKEIAHLRRRSPERMTDSGEGAAAAGVGGQRESLAFESTISTMRGDDWWAAKKARLDSQGNEYK